MNYKKASFQLSFGSENNKKDSLFLECMVDVIKINFKVQKSVVFQLSWLE